MPSRAAKPTAPNGHAASAVAPASRCDEAIRPDPILDAAEAVALRDGVGRVTLDAVAKEAGLSKSGLIHHYPSKDALIGALVLRKVAAWREHCDASMARHKGLPGGAALGLMDACFECPDAGGSDDEGDEESSKRRGCVVLAALVHDAKHIDPVRKMHREIDRKLAGDRLPPGVSDVVHLALNGLWFNWVFNLSDLTPQRLEQVRKALLRLVGPPVAAKSVPASAVLPPSPVSSSARQSTPVRKRVKK